MLIRSFLWRDVQMLCRILRALHHFEMPVERTSWLNGNQVDFLSKAAVHELHLNRISASIETHIHLMNVMDVVDVVDVVDTRSEEAFVFNRFQSILLTVSSTYLIDQTNCITHVPVLRISCWGFLHRCRDYPRSCTTYQLPSLHSPFDPSPLNYWMLLEREGAEAWDSHQLESIEAGFNTERNVEEEWIHVGLSIVPASFQHHFRTGQVEEKKQDANETKMALEVPLKILVMCPASLTPTDTNWSWKEKWIFLLNCHEVNYSYYTEESCRKRRLTSKKKKLRVRVHKSWTESWIIHKREEEETLQVSQIIPEKWGRFKWNLFYARNFWNGGAGSPEFQKHPQRIAAQRSQRKIAQPKTVRI